MTPLRCVCKLRKLGTFWDFILRRFIFKNILIQPKQQISWGCMKICRVWSSHCRRLPTPQESWALAAEHTRSTVTLIFASQLLLLHWNLFQKIKSCLIFHRMGIYNKFVFNISQNRCSIIDFFSVSFLPVFFLSVAMPLVFECFMDWSGQCF